MRLTYDRESDPSRCCGAAPLNHPVDLVRPDVENRNDLRISSGNPQARLTDATWTLCPKHESDVAAGVVLINLLAGGPRIADQLISFLKGTEVCKS